MSKLSATHILVGSVIAVVLPHSNLFTDSYAQNIIGYSEATITVTDEESFCSSKSLQITDESVIGNEGNGIADSRVGSQVVIEASITSNCEINNYQILIAFDVRDSEGLTRYFAFQNITMSQGDQAKVGFSWIADEVGDYDLRILALACLRCSGDFGVIRTYDFTVSQSWGEVG